MVPWNQLLLASFWEGSDKRPKGSDWFIGELIPETDVLFSLHLLPLPTLYPPPALPHSISVYHNEPQ